MEVTEANVCLQTPRVRHDGVSDDHLLAFATIVLDDAFRVDGLKVIRGNRDNLFVAMPTRRADSPCGRCRVRNGLRDNFCRACGVALDRYGVMAAAAGPEGKVRLDYDVVHPINAACREMVEDAVLEKYFDEVEAAGKAPAPAPLAGRVALVGRA